MKTVKYFCKCIFSNKRKQNRKVPELTILILTEKSSLVSNINRKKNNDDIIRLNKQWGETSKVIKISPWNID